MIENLKKNWNVIAEVAAWLSAIIGGFLREPPTTYVESSGQIARFGQFFLTLALGLMLIPVFRFQKKGHFLRWFASAVVLVALASLIFFSYNHYNTSWTCEYSQRRIIIGPDSALTDHGKEYKKDNPELTNAEVVWNHSGKVDEIWTSDSIQQRHLRLSVIYVLCLPICAASVLCVVQAFYCGSRKR